MGAIHISVCHDHNPVITQIFGIKIFPFNPQTQGSNQGLDFSIFINLGIIGLFNIEDLASQRQDCLETTITALLGGAASRISLNNVDLGFSRIARTAIRQLARQC